MPVKRFLSRAKSLPLVTCFLLLLSAGTALAQSPPATAPPPAISSDYSQEPFVIEQYFTRVRFENDGVGERELTVRIKVQSDAGVQQLGELVFGYNSVNERMDVGFVRVHKADGSVVTAAAGAVKELTASVAREAPVYTDFKEKHISVPALRPGETLEYQILTHILTPLAAGQFWYDHNFLEGTIVLDERLEVNVPRQRAVKLKTESGAEPKSSEEGDRRIYRWTHAVREHPSEDENKKRPAKQEPKPPAVQLTTFPGWEEVGRWYAQLERDRVTPTPEIRAKVQELTRDRATELEKIQALYGYVAKNIRYVSLSFGVGRYQPHAATEIFSNQYGDCKDKHTLLAAMLEAAGIRSDAVLIPFARKLDPDVPSPSQFDHLITAVPLGDDLLWMDTTAEVAPFRLLSANLRHKQALVVPPDGAGRLMETPADPPFLSTQLVEIEGQVSELGKLTAHLRYRMRGDNEFGLRVAFRKTPQAQWKQLGQTIALLDGFRGEVTDVKASDPAATEEPFDLDLQYAQANFLDWSSKKARLALPLPAVGMPEAAEDNADAIELGSPLDVTMRAKLTLPEKYAAQAPVAVAVMRDYAEYRSSYKAVGNIFTAERIMRFRLREVPASRTGDYLAFARAVQSDENQTLAVESSGAGTPTIPESAKADELYEAALAAFRSNNFSPAVELFRRVVELVPKHKFAWNNLGRAQMGLGQMNDAVASFRKQIEVNPYDEFAYNNLGRALRAQHKDAEAAEAFRKQIETNPLDKFAHANLGSLLIEQKNYAEAVPELEKAAVLTPDNSGIQIMLGQAYLNLGQKDKALAAFEKGVQLAPSPMVWNNVAYELSQHNLQLDRALQYAESAVQATAAQLRNVDLDHVTRNDLAAVASLAAYWDTLGWVHYQRGELDLAEPFLRSAWQLGQHGEVGDHLAQLYQKRGLKQQAIHTYALALAAARTVPETRRRLAALLGGDAGVKAQVDKVREELGAMRTVSLGKQAIGEAQAEFFLLLAPGAKASEAQGVKFIRGDEKLRGFEEKLRAASYADTFPDASPIKLVRRGILSCLAATRECSLVLVLPEDVRTVD